MRKYNQLFIAVVSVSMIVGTCLLSSVSYADESFAGRERSGSSQGHREGGRGDSGGQRFGQMPAGGGVANGFSNRAVWNANSQSSFNRPIATPTQSDQGRHGWQGSGNRDRWQQGQGQRGTQGTSSGFNNANRPNESFQGAERRGNDRPGWGYRGTLQSNIFNERNRLGSGYSGLSRGWTNHYRMPYWQGDAGRYRVHYYRSWPSDYGWRDHGWRVNYQIVDPYWYAIATSMAYSQTWSDVELAQAINDDNLRQQLIYDADVRQQMQASGYPVDQMDYPPDETGQPPYPDEQGYPTNPEHPNPNSPLYQESSSTNTSVNSGEQIANLNANKNFLFLCNAGNRIEAAEALKQVQSADLSVWRDVEQFNTCRSWAITP